MTAPERLVQLLDEGSARPIEAEVRLGDPLRFVDSVPYADRWAANRRKTGLEDAVVVARGTVEGNPVVAAVMDFRFLGGSLGGAVGELVTVAAETALAERTPLLLVTSSGGARMQEGAVALMQMAKTAQALGALDRAGVLTVSLITDPTYGGVAASFATLTDVIVAEPGARLGFAGPRVIQQTIRQKLPEGFQTAELLLSQGHIDAIRPRHALRRTLARLFSLGRTVPTDAATLPADPVVTDPALLPEIGAWEATQRARDLTRPTTLEHLGRSFSDVEELHGDRVSGDCPALLGGVARLAGRPVVFLGSQKGHTPAELVERNYGMAQPSGYRKAARLARLAGKIGIPVVTLVDTPGAYPGLEAEERGQSVAIASLIQLFSALPVPVVTVITGEGGSGGALALAVADRVLIAQNGTYSVISPEGCAAILWSDGAEGPRAAEALHVDARRLLAEGIVDGVVPEPPGGSGTDHQLAAELVKGALLGALDALDDEDPERLVAARQARFRRFGAELVTVRGEHDGER
jgi:acetyl-CoA carboxylase carboxyl transferase subunit beta